MTCWKEIGIWGSSTCEQLVQVSHCHHCAVYTAAGAQLLQRAALPQYRNEQTEQIAAIQKPYDSSQLLSVLIFRLAHEWLALPAGLCQQIVTPIAHHTLPHRSNATLLGIVNIRGQLLLKVSLLAVLGLDSGSMRSQKNRSEKNISPESTHIYPRMLVIEKPNKASKEAPKETGEADTWVFDVDELYGLHSVAFNQLETAAAGISSAVESCTQQVFSWQGKPVNFLNDVRLFEALRQQAL